MEEFKKTLKLAIQHAEQLGLADVQQRLNSILEELTTDDSHQNFEVEDPGRGGWCKWDAPDVSDQ